MANGVLQPGDIIPEALSWENFELNLFGAQVIKFSAFEFEFSSELNINTGKGGEGVSWSIKSYKRTAKATLHLDEMKRLINLAAASGGDILKLPAAPVIARYNVPNVGILQLIIPAAKITKGSIGAKQGDDKNESPLDLGVISYPQISWV